MNVHFILQGKGGVGKSLIASLLAQYVTDSGANLICKDTDPVNDTFGQYKSLNAERVNVLNADQEIDSRVFDSLFEEIINHNGPVIIDNGASTFIPMAAYLADNNVVELLQSMGKTVYIHTVLTGGQAMDDTVNGLIALLNSQPAQVIVWENEFFGAVERGGKRFTDLKLYAANKDRIKGVINIKHQKPATTGKDIEMMISNKMTFNDALSSELFSIMPRQRLITVRKEIYQQLEAIGI